MTKFAGQDAEDVLQEAAIGYAGLEQAPANPVSWLVARARRRQIDAWRKRETRVQAEADFMQRVGGELATPDARVRAAQVLQRVPERQRWWLVGNVLTGSTGASAGSTHRARVARYRDSLESL